MKKLVVTFLVLALVSLIWSKFRFIPGQDKLGITGAIFSLRELIGLAIALCALEPLLDLPKRREVRDWMPQALAGVLVGVAIIAPGLGVALALAAVAVAFVLEPVRSGAESDS